MSNFHHNKSFRGYLILLGIWVAATLSGTTLTQDPKLRSGKLSNGLTYYIYPNDNPKGSAIYRLFIKSGSVLEEENQRGLAHFIEHMAFNGTRHFPNDSIIRYLQKNGAKFGRDINAHTSMNETVYKLNISTKDPQLVENTLTILSDWAGGILFDSLQVEKERGVILSEWLSKEGASRDAQRLFLNDLLNESRYSKRETIGDTAILRHFPRRELINYYQKWYNPSLMAVSVVGDIDPDKIEQLIREKFSPLQSVKIDKKINYPIDNFKKEKMIVAEDRGSNKISLTLTQLMDLSRPINSEKEYFNYLQRKLINRLALLRFNAITIEKQTYNKASMATSSLLNVKDALFASVQLPVLNTEEAATAFARDLEQIYRYGFTEQEIDRVKKERLEEMRRQSMAKTSKNSSSLTDEIYTLFFRGSAIVTRAEEFRLTEQYLPRIDSLSLVRLLHRLHKPKQTHYMLTSYDLKEKNLDAQALFTQVRKEPIARYNKNIIVPDRLISYDVQGGSILREDTLPEIQAKLLELSNGIKVLFRSMKSNSDKITLSGFRHGGLYSIDSTLYISGQYAGGLIAASGTQNLSRDQITHLLAGSSASVRMLIDKNRCGIAATANPEDLETMLQLLYLRWTEPKVDSVTFNLYKQKNIEALENERKTPQKEFEQKMMELSVGSDYSTRPITPTIVRDELKIESLLPIFNHCYGDPSGFVFSLIGDCSLEDVRPLIEKYLAGIPNGESVRQEPQLVYPGPQLPKEKVCYNLKGGESPKASVIFLFQQDSLYQDFASFKMVSELAQGVIKERLMKVLREEMGKIYSISVGCSSTLTPTTLARQSISFACNPEDLELLSKTIFDQLQALCSSPDSFVEDLTNVQKSLIKDWSTNQKSASFWSTAIRNHYYYDLKDWKETTDFDQMVQEVSAKEVAQFIRETLLNCSYIRGVLLPREPVESGN